MTLSGQFAGAFADVALKNVTREYPRKLDHLLTAPQAALIPRDVHPSFYGSYDWHSAVHMHWLLARILRTHPQLASASKIARTFDAHLSTFALQRELAYFGSPAGRTFERPYGWAWLLELQAELSRLGERRWIESVRPLATLIAARFAAFVSAAPYPIRAGSHGNTAFACVLALDFAHSAQHDSLAQAIRSAARRWYAADRNAPLAYEPSLDDFLSPALVEAVLMREVLGKDEFGGWLQGFLPQDLGPLATPPVPPDRTDPKQSHLDGLCLSRAWCFKQLGGNYLPHAERHLHAGLPRVVGGDYVGEHWLASFAALALGEWP
jgi:DUF2891 family protein